jgi:hypothetical protein
VIVSLIGVVLAVSLAAGVSEMVTAYDPGGDVTIPVVLEFMMDWFFRTAMWVCEVCESAAPCKYPLLMVPKALEFLAR